MGTRSNIGILEPNGSVTYIYCHWDGYLNHHGPILRDHYKTEEKVRALIALGSISTLGQELGEKHHFVDQPGGVCTAYGRDRGESGTDADNDTKEVFYTDQRFAYLFDPATLSWTYYNDGNARPLVDAINAKPNGTKEAASMNDLPKWELVVDDRDHAVRRVAVPTGWIYQTQNGRRYNSLPGTLGRADDSSEPMWGPIVFVPQNP